MVGKLSSLQSRDAKLSSLDLIINEKPIESTVAEYAEV